MTAEGRQTSPPRTASRIFSSTPCAGHAILNCVAFDAQLDTSHHWDVEAKAGFNVCHPLYLVSKPWRNSASPRIRQLSFHRPRPIGKMEGKTKRATTVSWSESGQLSVSQPKFKTYGRIHSIYPGGIFSVRPHHVYTVLTGAYASRHRLKVCQVNLSNSVIPASGLADTEAPSLSRPESGTQLKSPTMTHGALPGTKEGSVLKNSRLAEGRLGAHTLQREMLPCGYLNRMQTNRPS
ncbi:hypothetical protein BSL78_16316 [Apostichopus japonicus]|uniref:Uncharacterized protein n=1 Tax=Stichopus japonicus TaxID=307972 RepID=A0A2G8KFP1_STIJA|nr:hypothetical protein BSL78_16316 [Apostichopus japonicus]